MAELGSGDLSGGDETSTTEEEEDSRTSSRRRRQRPPDPGRTEGDETAETEQSAQSVEESDPQGDPGRGEPMQEAPPEPGREKTQQEHQGRELADNELVRRDQLRTQRRRIAEQEGVNPSDVAIRTQNGRATSARIQPGAETAGGREILARNRVAAQNENVEPGDVRVETDRFGNVQNVSVAESTRRQQVRERVASENENVDPEDVQVSFQENTPVSGGDQRLAEEEGSDIENARRTTVGVSLTEEARRDILRDRAREEFPNAEEIEIVEEDGELRAEIERESEVDSVRRSAEEIIDDPSTVVDATVETGETVVSGVQSGGEATVDAVTNPRETAGAVGDFVTTGIDRNVQALESTAEDVEYSINNPEQTVEDNVQASREFIDEGVERNVEILSGAESAGDDVADATVDTATSSARFVGMSFERFRGSGAGQAAVAAAPVAAAEPTPVGEVSLGAAVVGGTVVAGGGLAAQELTDTREATLQEQQREPLDNPAGNQIGSRRSPVTPTTVELPARREAVIQSEFDAPESREPTSTTEVDTPEGREPVMDSEVDAPESREPVTKTEITEPEETFREQSRSGVVDGEEPIQLGQQLTGQGVGQNIEDEVDDDLITSEDLVDDYISRPPPLRNPDRRLGVNRRSSVSRLYREAQQQEVDVGEEDDLLVEDVRRFVFPASTGTGAGVDQQVDQRQAQGQETASQSAVDVATDQTVGVVSETDVAVDEVQTAAQQNARVSSEQAIQQSQAEVFENNLENQTQQETVEPNVNANAEANLEAYEFGYNATARTRARRPRIDLEFETDDSDPDRSSRGVFVSRFKNPVADPDEAIQSFVGGDENLMEDLDL